MRGRNAQAEQPKIKEVQSVCSTRIPGAQQSFRELSDGTPGNRATHTMFDSLADGSSHNISRNPSKFRGGKFSRASAPPLSLLFRLSCTNSFRGPRLGIYEESFRGNRSLRPPFVNGKSPVRGLQLRGTNRFRGRVAEK